MYNSVAAIPARFSLFYFIVAAAFVSAAVIIKGETKPEIMNDLFIEDQAFSRTYDFDTPSHFCRQ
jgi:hypothetical protein